MADKRVSELPAAESIGDDDLFVMEQGGEAKSITGAKLKGINSRKPIKKINVAAVSSSAVIEYVFDDDSTASDAIDFDSEGYPVKISVNGTDIPVEWTVPDA